MTSNCDLYSASKYEYKSVFFKECAVAGTSFHIEPFDDIWHELYEGLDIALVREKSNKYDPNAIAVALAGDYDGNPDEFDFTYILGYIPRSENEALARMMDAGYGDRISAKITSYRAYGNVNSRIRISIYLKSQCPMAVRRNLLRGVTINFDLFRDLTTQLEENGVVVMPLAAPDEGEILQPIEGEKVVAIYDEDPEYYVLYLLRVFATGSKGAPYLANFEGYTYYNYNNPYVLTNIIGPVLIKKDEHNFLEQLDISELNPCYYLNETISKEFEWTFAKVLLRPLNRNNIDMDPSLDDPEEKI